MTENSVTQIQKGESVVAAILRHLDTAPHTRAQLAKVLGLPPTTISKALARLQKQGAVDFAVGAWHPVTEMELQHSRVNPL